MILNQLDPATSQRFGQSPAVFDRQTGAARQDFADQPGQDLAGTEFQTGRTAVVLQLW